MFLSIFYQTILSVVGLLLCFHSVCVLEHILQYLKKHQDNLQGVSREHFSFSPRMPVGDFYEERETPEVCIQSSTCATDIRGSNL